MVVLQWELWPRENRSTVLLSRAEGGDRWRLIQSISDKIEKNYKKLRGKVGLPTTTIQLSYKDLLSVCTKCVTPTDLMTQMKEHIGV